MSLLLLLGGASAPVVGDDRTFTATWEQAAAGWEAVAVKLNADGSFVQNQSWSATATGPGTPESLSEFPMLERVERPPRKFRGVFLQPPGGWRAEMDQNDDEITLQELGVL